MKKAIAISALNFTIGTLSQSSLIANLDLFGPVVCFFCTLVVDQTHGPKASTLCFIVYGLGMLLGSTFAIWGLILALTASAFWWDEYNVKEKEAFEK